jgi:hypothetical protein
MGADEKNLSIRSGSFMILAGLGALGYFGWLLFQQASAAAWPTTKAEVVVSNMEVETTVSAKRGVQDFYLANVAYEYTVAGKSYTGTELWFDSEPKGSREDMQALLADYPLGKQIEVYVDPHNPQRAVVLPDKNAGIAKIAIGLGAVSLLIGAYVLYGGLTAKPVEGAFEAIERDEEVKPTRPQPVAAPLAERRIKPQPAPDVVKSPAPSRPSHRRPRHWLVRAIAGTIGLPTLLVFGAVTVMILQQGLGPQAKHPLAVTIGSTLISGGIALFGLWLTTLCFRRGGQQQDCAAMLQRQVGQRVVG